MRFLYLLLLAVFTPAFLCAQYLYNTDFSTLTLAPCPFNANVMVTQPEGWLLYQTTDGNWDGPYDSTRCINLQPFPFYGMQVALDQINPERPLFLKALLPAFNPLQYLQSDWEYSSVACFDLSPGAPSLKTGTDCAQGICSGVFIGIAIPDSFGHSGMETRYHTGLTNSDLSTGNFFCASGLGTCFPTEYFPDQYLRQYVLKFSFDSTANLSGHYLNIHNIFFDPLLFPVGLINAVEAYPGNYANGQYTVNVSQASGGGFWDNYLLQYLPIEYPSPAHPSYVEAVPVPNTSVPQTIALSVEPYQNLQIQPFAYLRGALVDGSDSVRHHAVLENNGGSICLNFIDVVFNGAEYKHSGGTVEMHNAMSCMQFRNNSDLRVTKGATLQYGDHGAGMIILCASSTIALERDATLLVDGVVSLSECSADQTPQQIYMDLPPGARLVFGDHAHLTNQYSYGKQMKLNINMLGGTLEDDALPAADRALINRIYPKPSPNPAENVTVWPNPFDAQCTVSYLADAEETLQLSWTDLQGRVVLQEKHAVFSGLQEWQPNTPPVPGMYSLVIETKVGRVVKKMVNTGR